MSLISNPLPVNWYECLVCQIHLLTMHLTAGTMNYSPLPLHTITFKSINGSGKYSEPPQTYRNVDYRIKIYFVKLLHDLKRPLLSHKMLSSIFSSLPGVSYEFPSHSNLKFCTPDSFRKIWLVFCQKILSHAPWYLIFGNIKNTIHSIRIPRNNSLVYVVAFGVILAATWLLSRLHNTWQGIRAVYWHRFLTNTI